ncbi:MAG: hypothetical protein K2R98_19425 [Gemmataceae bacterium]|nr:hypothetical protein [Gemmataceae bacterium]
MKLKLHSNFSDYYDYQFDLDGEVFERMGTGGPTRREMFVVMERLGLRVPEYGRVTDLKPLWAEVVVYLDERAHCGDGKVRLPLEQAIMQYPQALASCFLPPGGESIRELHIGNRCFRLRYTSVDDWRSNCGEGDCEVLGEVCLPAYRGKVSHALFAIDFVPCGGKEWAVDFNIAPGMRGSGMERIMSASDVVKELKGYLSSFQEDTKCGS